jgi:hypothetical protein
LIEALHRRRSAMLLPLPLLNSLLLNLSSKPSLLSRSSRPRPNRSMLLQPLLLNRRRVNQQLSQHLLHNLNQNQ